MRVRFAPSPTGYLHVGGARTALFNWLAARHESGTFILRIEDTDRTRSTSEFTEAIFDAMRWLELGWEEGPGVGGPHAPYFQMERLARYGAVARDLVAAGRAYPCFCRPKGDESAGEQTTSPAEKCCCRERPAGTQTGPAAIRFETPHAGNTTVVDLIHGEVVFDNREIDDFIIVKADGVPTYNFAVVVDDADMAVSHVLRGDDHLSNTPKQLLVYQALGWPPPRFGHIPMILGPDRKRLSKRHGAVSIQAFREEGYLSEAVVNYITRLGWAHGDQEIFTRAELVAAFSLAGVGKSAAVFDHAKLEWLNGEWMRRTPVPELAARARPFFERLGLLGPGQVEPRLEGIVASLQERSRTLVALAEQARYYFDVDLTWDDEARGQLLTPAIRPALEALVRTLEGLAEWSPPVLESAFRTQAAGAGLKAGQLIGPARVALTGGKASPGIFEVVHLLGRERTLARLGDAIASIPAPVA